MPIGLSHDADKGECALKAVTQFRNRFVRIVKHISLSYPSVLASY